MMNQFSRGRYLLTLAIVILGFIFTLPNFYGSDPALQIKAKVNTLSLVQAKLSEEQANALVSELKGQGLQSSLFKDNTLVVRFNTVAEQQAAKELLSKELGDQFIVAKTFETKAPTWLAAMGANPMNYGLDLRGGVHFLMSVGVNDKINSEAAGQLHNVEDSLREQNIPYSGITTEAQQGTKALGLVISFRNPPYVTDTQALSDLNQAESYLSSNYSNFEWHVDKANIQLTGALSPAYIQKQRQTIMNQVIGTLNSRVNQLGVSDASVVQQGEDRVAIDLPGIQDAAQAQSILGETASLEFHIIVDPQDVQPGQTLVLKNRAGQDVNMYSDVVLDGSSITSATAGEGQGNTFGPVINISLSGSVSKFEQATIAAAAKNESMATVFIKKVPAVVKTKDASGQEVDTVTYTTERVVINQARVDSGLGTQFQIEGLGSMEAADQLALLLRAGSLSAPVAPLEEEVVGPSLGAHNISLGEMSIAMGFIAIVVFMLFYYSVFGIIANIALLSNLFLQLGVLSLLGASLTLPGIAGIVLTLGMAVDANVLIYERIREELRSGNNVQASLHAGFEKAFGTIVDANVSTLIVAGVLFWIGAGPVQGFAVTLSIGILTSMFTAIMVTRALVNITYGNRAVKRLRIGMKPKAGKT